MPARPVIDLGVLRSPTAILGVAVAVACLAGGAITLALQPFMVDLEIPLRAAERWARGDMPYLASAFAPDARGYDLPFLYPPPVLPILAAISGLPRAVLIVPWLGLLLAAATWLLRRLGVPWWAVPVGLAWVPFSEGLVGGNAGVLLVAGFVGVFFGPPAGDWRPAARGPGIGRRSALAEGLAVAAAPALKLSQPHAWAALLRRRPAAALAGLAVVVGFAAATLPLTGLEPWGAWLDQLARAADPAWALRGSSLVQVVPPPISFALTALSVGAVFVVPPARLPAAAGLLLVLGAPSLRNYGVLFMLPAMLSVRRDVAVAAVLLVGLGVAPAVWAGVGLVTLAFAGSLRPGWARRFAPA